MASSGPQNQQKTLADAVGAGLHEIQSRSSAQTPLEQYALAGKTVVPFATVHYS